MAGDLRVIINYSFIEIGYCVLHECAFKAQKGGY